MNKVKLDLTGMTPGQKARFALVVGQCLVNHEGAFPEQPIAGGDLMDFANGVTQMMMNARAARATWRELVSVQNDLLAQLDGYLRQTASYVQNVSAGNPAIIELAGLNVRNASGKVGPLPAPEGFVAAAISNPGTVTLKWSRVKSAASYLIQYMPATNLPTAFENDVPVTRTKHTITGLTSGTRYWFRVAAIGAAGPSPWSNAVSVVTQ